MKNLLPKIYKKDIYNINYKLLKKKGCNSLFFDMDNTLIDYSKKEPTKEIIQLFKELETDGFKIFILSNSLPKRLNKFTSMIRITDSISFACKPSKKAYIKLINKHKLNPNKIACIGDQIYTDIKGANKLNLLSILVDPISNKEHILTKLNRIKEQKIYKKYIKRGEYYE